jgi:hypothetical protein
MEELDVAAAREQFGTESETSGSYMPKRANDGGRRMTSSAATFKRKKNGAKAKSVRQGFNKFESKRKISLVPGSGSSQSLGKDASMEGGSLGSVSESGGDTWLTDPDIAPPKLANKRVSTMRGSLKRTVRFFRQKFTLEDAIGSHACSLEALACI